MNKFIFAFALVACVAVASAKSIDDEPSEMALFESDDIEVKYLSEERAVYKDFCLSARDEVRSYLKSSMGGGSSKLFNSIAETIGTITQTIGDAYNQAIKENGDGISSGELGVGQALLIMSSAVTGTAKTKVYEQIEELKSQLSTDTLQEAADTACMHISGQLKSNIDRMLTAYKKSLKAASPDLPKSVLDAKLNNVGCVTTSRLSKVATMCNLMRTMAPSVMDFLGY